MTTQPTDTKAAKIEKAMSIRNSPIALRTYLESIIPEARHITVQEIKLTDAQRASLTVSRPVELPPAASPVAASEPTMDADIAALKKELLADPKQAQALLQEAGIVDERGKLTAAFGGKEVIPAKRETLVQASDPMDTSLPCDVKIGGNTFRKGVSLSTFVGAARRWHREAFPAAYNLTDEQKDANLARLQGCAEPVAAHAGVLFDGELTWRGEDGSMHFMTLDGARDDLKRLYDEFPGGIEEVEAAMKHRDPAEVLWEVPEVLEVLEDSRNALMESDRDCDYPLIERIEALDVTLRSHLAGSSQGVEMLTDEASGETMTQREEVCAAWHELPDDLRKDQRLTRLYRALGGPRMDDPAIASQEAAAQTKESKDE